MPAAPDDALTRALAALERVPMADLPAAASEAWQQAKATLLDVLLERLSYRAVEEAAWALLAALGAYEKVIASGDMDQIASLAANCEAAERELAQALDRLSAQRLGQPGVAPPANTDRNPDHT